MFPEIHYHDTYSGVVGDKRIGFKTSDNVPGVSAVCKTFEECAQSILDGEKSRREEFEKQEEYWRKRGAEIRSYEGCYDNDLDAN